MNAMPQVGNSVFERGIELATREDVDSAAMASFIGDDLADTLSQAANTNDDAYWIGTNVDVYSEFGWAVQRKLLRLAAMQPDALPYVRGFPSYYPSEQGYTEGADSGAIPDENNVDGVPILYQWDTRWGYLDYGGLAFGLAGCCPTALSMAYQGLTGDTSMTPADMAIFAEEQGRVVYNGGTDGVLLENLGQLGLVGRITASNADSIIWELKNGAILIANVGPGDFTEGGHFITLTGVDADGLIVVNDPYSVTNTEKRWDASTIASQTKVLYAIRLA